MKPTRNLLFGILLLAFMGSVQIVAQDCNAYFPYKEGFTIEMRHYDKKDKLSGSSVQKVKSIRQIDGGMAYVMSQLFRDDKGAEQFSGDFEISCQDGLIRVDMKKLLGPAMMGAYEGMEVQIDGDQLEFPSSLQVGQVLKGGVMNITIMNQGMKMMSMQVVVSDRVVEAKENLTTPAGTFECYKIAYDTETKLLMKVKSKSEEWIAEGVGVVKMASYGSNGKLENYSVLTSFSR
ncbi:MAG: hypothetical protein KA053_04860 [Lentimicrobiaceae bacterium]|nr:hypothetical protein [Lentimicrobiaceae bacterium]